MIHVLFSIIIKYMEITFDALKSLDSCPKTMTDKEVIYINIYSYIVGGDGASRVARDKLELHIDVPKQILILGLES